MNNMDLRCRVFGMDVRPQSAANGCSIRKLCNAAAARIHGNPPGRALWAQVHVIHLRTLRAFSHASRLNECLNVFRDSKRQKVKNDYHRIVQRPYF